MSRHAHLVSSFAVVLFAASAVTHFKAAIAQEASPAADTALPPLLQQLVDAANAGDASGVAAIFTADGTHEDVPAGSIARGREEIAAYADGVFKQFSAVRFEPEFGNQSGNLALLEYTLSGTDLATGRPVTYRGVLVFELDGGLVRRGADYYDFAGILRQLGQLETGVATPAS